MNLYLITTHIHTCMNLVDKSYWPEHMRPIEHAHKHAGAREKEHTTQHAYTDLMNSACNAEHAYSVQKQSPAESTGSSLITVKRERNNKEPTLLTYNNLAGAKHHRTINGVNCDSDPKTAGMNKFLFGMHAYTHIVLC